MTDLVDLINDKNIKFRDDLEYVGCTSSLKPGIFWKLFKGTKKCDFCNKPATEEGKRVGKDSIFSCKDCQFR
jgi:hypothetical protein